jgi:hypothetical protein
MRVAGLRGCMRPKKRKTTRRDPRAAPAPRTSLAGTSWPLSPKQDLAGGHHLRTDAGRLPLAGFHPGHSFEKDRRLVDGRSHEDGTRHRRPPDGTMEAQAIRRTRASLRPGRPVGGDLVRQAPRRGRHHSFDGKDRECPGQSAMAQSFVATLKSELLLVHRRRFPDREVARSATLIGNTVLSPEWVVATSVHQQQCFLSKGLPCRLHDCFVERVVVAFEGSPADLEGLEGSVF